MLLARARFWRMMLQKSIVAIEVQRSQLGPDLQEVRDLRFEVPLEKWNRLVRNLNSDRKLLGGLLLDFAKHKDRVAVVIGNDRLLAEFRRSVLDATLLLVEEGVLELTIGGPRKETE